jgi:hypothetical protein
MTALDLPAPPERPALRSPRLLPAMAVLGVILVVLFGGYVIAAALSEPAGPAVDVGGVVRVAPLSGWAVAGRPFATPSVRLSRGGGTLDVAAFRFDGDATALLQAYLTRVKPHEGQLSVGAVDLVRLPSGVPGARVHYVGSVGGVQTSSEGEVTAVVLPSGVGVVFDGWAPEGLLRFVLEDVTTMVDRAEIAT